MDPIEPVEEQGLDIEAAAADIASDIFNGGEPLDTPADDEPIEGAPSGPVAGAVVTEPVVVRAAPSSWAKETHEVWSKLPPEAQAQIEHREKQMLEGLGQYKEHNEFGRVMKEAMAPYKAIMAAQGLDEPKTVQVLMNAHYRLSNGSPQQRAEYLSFLAKNYGIDMAQAPQPQASTLPQEVQAALAKVEQFEQDKIQHQQKQIAEARVKTTRDVTTFAEAKDEKGNLLRPYFDEVAEDIVGFIANGKTLEEAYEKAVYANPVTRQKEIARVTKENEANLRAKAKAEADAALKARSSNVRGRDTRRAPTEPLGTMEDTLKETLAASKARAH